MDVQHDSGSARRHDARGRIPAYAALNEEGNRGNPENFLKEHQAARLTHPPGPLIASGNETGGPSSFGFPGLLRGPHLNENWSRESVKGAWLEGADVPDVFERYERELDRGLGIEFTNLVQRDPDPVGNIGRNLKICPARGDMIDYSQASSSGDGLYQARISVEGRIYIQYRRLQFERQRLFHEITFKGLVCSA
jgi:hypothetical protein